MSVHGVQRIKSHKQSLDDAYNPPTNFLEIEVCRPITHTDEKGKRYTDYEVHMRTNLPIFRVKEFSTRRRYSDFEWLRQEVERDVQIHVPVLPGKAVMKQIPFMNQDDGIFEPEFIEDRREALENFINHVAGHPLVQNEKCLHAFLLEDKIDKRNFVPGKVGFK